MNIVHTGNRFQVYGDDVKTYKELPIGTYTIGFHPQMGIWLSVHNNLQIGEEKFMARIVIRQRKFSTLSISPSETLV